MTKIVNNQLLQNIAVKLAEVATAEIVNKVHTELEGNDAQLLSNLFSVELAYNLGFLNMGEYFEAIKEAKQI